MSEVKKTDLIGGIDNCKIFEVVQSIQGLPSDSGSPTDTIIVNFKEGVKFDDKDIKTGFLKIFLKDVIDEKGNIHDFDMNKKRAALIYEQKLYELIRVLIRLNYCPYFVQIYSNAVNCTYRDFGKLINLQPDINDDYATKLYTRSVFYMLFEGKDRPSVTDKRNLESNLVQFVNSVLYKVYDRSVITEMKNKGIHSGMIQQNSRFNFIINEIVKGEKGENVFKFYDSWSERDNIPFTNFIHMIFLQLFIAFYGLHLLKFNHNDIHPGNFWITSVPRRNVRYKIDDEIYEFDNLGIEVKIYDFDFSYTKIAGNNPFLETNRDTFMCEDYKVCNTFVPKRDLVILVQKFKAILSSSPSSTREILSHIDNNIMTGEMIGNDGTAYYLNSDKIKEPRDLLTQQLRVVGAKIISSSKCPYVKKSKKVCNEPVIKGKTYCKAHRKFNKNEKKGDRDQYDYSITKHKAELISKFVKGLLAVFNSKIGGTTFRKVIESKCREKTKKIFSEESAPKEEREEFLAEVTRTVEGRQKSISEDDLAEMCELV
jgi:hypothetical protein